MGLTYTDETKTGIAVPWKSLANIAFLKRKFVLQNDGTYMAPMDVPNVMEISNWVRGKAVKAATLENCEQSLAELSLHDQSTYEKWSARLREACHMKNLHLPNRSWLDRRAEYAYNRTGFEKCEYVPMW